MFALILLIVVLLFSSADPRNIKLKRWIPLAAKEGDEPQVLGLQDLGLSKERLDESAKAGILLQAVSLISDQVEDDICDPVPLHFEKKFLHYCSHLVGVSNCSELDVYIQKIGNSVTTRFIAEFDQFFFEIAEQLGDTPKILSMIFNETNETEDSHDIEKRQFDVIAMGMAETAIATSFTALGNSISNSVQIGELRTAYKQSEKVVNQHSDQISENHEDIVIVQQDVRTNAINIAKVNEETATVLREIQALKYGLALDSSIQRSFWQLKNSVHRAVLYGELSPTLVPEQRLMKGLRSKKGNAIASSSIYALYPQAFYDLGRIHVMSVFKNSSTVMASVCYPLILQTNVQVLYKVYAVGAVTNQSNVLAIPKTPPYVAFPFSANSFDQASYPDRSKCTKDKSFLIRCPPVFQHKLALQPSCSINPADTSSKCEWNLYRIPPLSEKLFVSSIRVGNSHYIVTNAKDYQIVSPKMHGKHSPYQAVNKVLDVYQIPTGGYIVFDKSEVIYGVQQIDVELKPPPELMIQVDQDTEQELRERNTATAITKAVTETEVHLEGLRGRNLKSEKLNFQFSSHWAFPTVLSFAGLLFLAFIIGSCCLWCKLRKKD